MATLSRLYDRSLTRQLFRGPLDRISARAKAAFGPRLLLSSWAGKPLRRVRRDSDNAELDIGHTPAGDLDLDALTLFLQAPRRPLLTIPSIMGLSLRRLGNYNGIVVRVRRDSDQLEANIGFNFLGEIDTSALLSFAGSASCFVVLWYGENVIASQGTAAFQPRIVNSGVLETANGKPTITFNGTQWMMAIFSGVFVNVGTVVSVVLKATGNASDQQIIDIRYGSDGGNSVFGFRTGTPANQFYGQFRTANAVLSAVSGGAFDTNLHVVSLSYGTTSSGVGTIMRRDGTQTAVGGESSGYYFDRIGIATNGFSPGSNNFTGAISEITIGVNAIPSETNRTLLEQSQAAYYSASYASTIPSGFATKEYDQTGNNRNPYQLTALNQPRVSNAGVLDLLNGRPVLYQNTSMRLDVPVSIGAVSTANYVARLISGWSQNGRILSGYPNWVMGFWNGLHSVYWTGYWVLQQGNVGAKTAIHTAITNGTVQLVARDGVPQGILNGAAANIATSLSTNGGWSGGFEGSENLWAEGTFFDDPIATFERQVLERDQGAYYGAAVA